LAGEVFPEKLDLRKETEIFDLQKNEKVDLEKTLGVTGVGVPDPCP